MSVTGIKKNILVACFLVLSIPVHEFGHYIVADTDGAQIHEFNIFCRFDGTRFVYPSVIINEFTFSSFEALILCHFAGFLITFVPGLLISIVLYISGSSFWYYSSTWVVSAPLVSLSDFDRVLELLGMNNIAKWVHVGLGVCTVLMLGFMRRKRKT